MRTVHFFISIDAFIDSLPLDTCIFASFERALLQCILRTGGGLREHASGTVPRADYALIAHLELLGLSAPLATSMEHTANSVHRPPVEKSNAWALPPLLRSRETELYTNSAGATADTCTGTAVSERLLFTLRHFTLKDMPRLYAKTRPAGHCSVVFFA